MLTINVITNGEEKVISGTIDGKLFNRNYSKELYDALKDEQETYSVLENMEEYEAWVADVNKILEEKEEDIIETKCPDLKKDPKTGKYFMVVEGKVSKRPVPQRLVDVILESIDKDLDPTPLVKFWVRLLRNPQLTADKAERIILYITAEIVDVEEMNRYMDEEGFTRDKAEARATYNDVMITQEGLICGYKYAELMTEGWTIDKETNKAVKKPLFEKEDDTIDPVTGVRTVGKTIMPEYVEELTFLPPVMGTGGDAFACGDTVGHVIKVGEVHKLQSWAQVNCNDNTSCVKGLHVGGRRYVASYSGLKCQLLTCFIDPSKIGAVCDIHRGDGAIRCLEYFIYGAEEGRTKGLYHSSKYAAMKDAEWAEYKKAAVEEANKRMADLKEQAENIGL